MSDCKIGSDCLSNRLIMINDGVADMRKTDDKIYKSAGAFMASLDHASQQEFRVKGIRGGYSM